MTKERDTKGDYMKVILNSHKEEKQFYINEFNILRRVEKEPLTPRMENMVKNIKKEILKSYVLVLKSEKEEFQYLLNENALDLDNLDRRFEEIKEQEQKQEVK